jgi:hypothetical protein
MDLKTPVKILDAAGNIKKVLIQKLLQFESSSTPTFYLKFPFQPFNSGGYGLKIITLNFTVFSYDFNTYKLDASYFKVTLRTDDGYNYVSVCIDNTLNHGQFNITGKNIIWIASDDIVNGFYLKLDFETGESLIKVSYIDISSNDNIPPNFSYDNMIMSSVPGTEHTWDNQSIQIVNSVDPYDSDPEKITLDPDYVTPGTINKYAKGDHTHLLDLSEIEIDLKLPVKIMDSAGNIKKVLIEKSIYMDTPSSLI